MQRSSPKKESDALGPFSLPFPSSTTLMRSGPEAENQWDVMHTLRSNSQPDAESTLTQVSNVCSHWCIQCMWELWIWTPIPESGRGGMGAGQGEELRKQEVVCWVPIGWRSRMMHSRAWGLRRQGTLAQIFPAPHFFFFFLLRFHAVQW